MNFIDAVTYGPGSVTTESTLNGTLPSAPGLYYARGTDLNRPGGAVEVVVGLNSGGVPFAPKTYGVATISGNTVVTLN